jgi:hypothetical protein
MDASAQRARIMRRKTQNTASYGPKPLRRPRLRPPAVLCQKRLTEYSPSLSAFSIIRGHSFVNRYHCANLRRRYHCAN